MRLYEVDVWPWWPSSNGYELGSGISRVRALMPLKIHPVEGLKHIKSVEAQILLLGGTTYGSVIAGSSSARAVKSVSWWVSCEMEVTRVEQRAYIKIAVLRGRNAMECHSELLESLGNNALP
ncbi:HTH_48 domain-containing protein [Trichonephila clavipes]|nr:HTH_48 domain-containing protein [Trichonephila clavipes]